MNTKHFGKKLTCALGLLLCLCLLAGCSGGDGTGKTFEVVTEPTQNTLGSLNATDTPTQAPTSVPDPIAEEIVPDLVTSIPDPVVFTDVPRMDSEYAGATPVVIDPIDKPTPTPLPALSFAAYQVYDATKLHLSFEAPAGWLINDEQDGIFVVTNPDTSVDYAASITVQVRSTATTYGTDDLKTEVKAMLSTLQSVFASFSVSNTASRSLLGTDGIYADYTATMDDGTRVAGRVQAVAIGKSLYVVHFSWPRDYNETYKDTVYAQFRKTLQVTQ